MKRQTDRFFAVAASLIVCAVLVIGVVKLGSPERQREAAADRRRLDDLQSIARAIYYRHTQNPNTQPLPASLGELPGGVQQQTADPVTGVPYEYRPGAGTSYQLCATFSTDGKDDLQGWQPYSREFWSHPKGHHCFELNAEKTIP
jgi:hypothetical protein